MAPFYAYVQNVAVYKCPADRYVSSAQASAGVAARPRSYSMNMFFGANFPGDVDSANNTFPTYTQFLKSASIQNPSQLFVTLDEHADSINDGFLQAEPYTDPSLWSPANWNDLPATYHAGKCCFAFADGHAEVHKFLSKLCTILPVLYTPYQGSRQVPFSSDTTGNGWKDGLWVAMRASVPN
jgi:prepilin-type processing-associated H-X9-DG protein